MINNIDDTIELYVKGKLTGPALFEFEQQMAADKQLASEVALQKHAISAIQESRRLSLKARLNNIPVSTGSTSGSGNSISNFSKFFSIKSAAVVVATVGVGIGAFFFTQNQIDVAENVSENSLENVNPDTAMLLNSGSVATSTAPAVAETDDYKPENTAPTNTTSQSQSVSTIENSTSSAPKARKISANGEAMLDQKFEDGSDGEVATEEVSAPKNTVASEDTKKKSEVDIKNISDGKYNFHYMLKENTLFLYGSFDATPYEILEFNEREGQSIYLYYDNSFFELKTAEVKPAKLKKITDEKLVAELTEARNKKH